jgi:hypothetical protein
MCIASMLRTELDTARGITFFARTETVSLSREKSGNHSTCLVDSCITSRGSREQPHWLLCLTPGPHSLCRLGVAYQTSAAARARDRTVCVGLDF